MPKQVGQSIITCEHTLSLVRDRPIGQGPAYRPWPEEILSIIEEAKGLDDNLEQLIEIVELYEEFGPPHVRLPTECWNLHLTNQKGKCGIFSQFDHPASPHLPDIPIPPHRLSAYISEPFPAQFWDLQHLLHSVWHPVTFLGWIHQQYFLDPETKVMWGGKGGIRWIVFSLVRMVLQTAQKKENPDTRKVEQHTGFVDSVEMYVGACCNLVIQQVQGSIAILSRANRARQVISEDQMAHGEPPIPYLPREPEVEPVVSSPAKSFRFKSPLEEGSSTTPRSTDKILLQSIRATGFDVNAKQVSQLHHTHAHIRLTPVAVAPKKSPTRSILKRTRPTPDSSPIQPSSSKKSRPGELFISQDGPVSDDTDVEEELEDETPSTSSTSRAGSSADTGKGKQKAVIVEEEEDQEPLVIGRLAA